MAAEGIIKITVSLTLLELPVEPVEEEKIKQQYRAISKIYHPDVANERYKDGKRFTELKEARDFLLENINYVNEAIVNFDKEENERILREKRKYYERVFRKEVKAPKWTAPKIIRIIIAVLVLSISCLSEKPSDIYMFAPMLFVVGDSIYTFFKKRKQINIDKSWIITVALIAPMVLLLTYGATYLVYVLASLVKGVFVI